MTSGRPHDGRTASPAALTTLLAGAEHVLFDFDGPLAHLFAGHPAPQVAAVLRERVASWEAPGRPPGDPAGDPAGIRLTSPTDPFQVLADVARAYRGRPAYDYRVAELDKLLGEHEAIAAGSAQPTAHARDLVRALVNQGRVLSVTTNNTAAAVSGYLEAQGLADCFGARVHGRRHARPELMKPHPSCLREAMRRTGATADSCLMVGDSVSDFEAARAVGVPFLGFARTARKRGLLADAGAAHVVAGLAPVLDAVKA
jgi:HAD superfamily hydrolase (TIGR01509 family)